ncbi:hypothetical protein LC613_08360 [Nostoc sphaeroides CHAB 2801]|uniref:hypothetical protein n=1 Tax=Nostoc sphaeroides TaxID=446679 RepID=UPI000E556C3A|nr:hypothetical protein [Nostoc sphaeroides]MCC5628135.1 hypothetical protein [Nostoc sphaeroides CHAB 2801]
MKRQFSEWFTRNSRKYQARFLEEYRIDVDYDSTPINAGEAYCRLWLVEMRLAKDVDWFRERYPVVHAAIRFNHGGESKTIPYLAQPGHLEELSTENLNRVIQCNYALTPLFPFNDGLVELQAGLFSIVNSDPIGKFMKTMGRFSKLLSVAPNISSVMKIIEPIYRGIEDLIGAGESCLELGYQQTFSAAGGGGKNDLKAGYLVAILAEENQINPDTLCIVDDSLKMVNYRLNDTASGRSKDFIRYAQPLEGYSYMLFRIEKRTYQDWDSLTQINELVTRAQEAVFKGEYDNVKVILLPAIKTAIYSSQDVTKVDRQNMVLKIQAQLSEIGLQGATTQKRSLFSIMQRPLPFVDAQTEAELAALEQLFT